MFREGLKTLQVRRRRPLKLSSGSWSEVALLFLE